MICAGVGYHFAPMITTPKRRIFVAFNLRDPWYLRGVAPSTGRRHTIVRLILICARKLRCCIIIEPTERMIIDRLSPKRRILHSRCMRQQDSSKQEKKACLRVCHVGKDVGWSQMVQECQANY